MWNFDKTLSLVIAFLTLALVVQHAGLAHAAPARLTAEGYRDLIVSTADPLSSLGAYGDVANGSGKCLINFTPTDAAMQQADTRIRTWENARPAEALAKSHAEILKWMKSARERVNKIGSCIEPVMQQPEEQFYFFAHLGSYQELRKEAAAALSALNVELPPLPKK